MMYCFGAAAVAAVSFAAGYLYKQSRFALSQEILVAETDFATTFKALQKMNLVFIPEFERNEEERTALIGQIRAMAERFLSDDDDQLTKAMHEYKNTDENMRTIEVELDDILFGLKKELLEKHRRFRHETNEIETTLTNMLTEKERKWQEQRLLWIQECNDKISVISELRKKTGLSQGQLENTWNRLMAYAKIKR